ncbi:hypothetical protein KUCAC02_014366, partial [Chaenocephalus aceratus]
ESKREQNGVQHHVDEGYQQKTILHAEAQRRISSRSVSRPSRPLAAIKHPSSAKKRVIDTRVNPSASANSLQTQETNHHRLQLTSQLSREETLRKRWQPCDRVRRLRQDNSCLAVSVKGSVPLKGDGQLVGCLKDTDSSSYE